jgi:hypothetical protein
VIKELQIMGIDKYFDTNIAGGEHDKYFDI